MLYVVSSIAPLSLIHCPNCLLGVARLETLAWNTLLFGAETWKSDVASLIVVVVEYRVSAHIQHQQGRRHRAASETVQIFNSAPPPQRGPFHDSAPHRGAAGPSSLSTTTADVHILLSHPILFVPTSPSALLSLPSIHCSTTMETFQLSV